jgi:hypothetical protein
MRKQLMVAACLWSALALTVACSDGGSGGGTGGQGGNAGSSASGGSGGQAGQAGQCKTSTSVADCVAICPGVVAAGCADGPATQAECEQGCKDLNDYVSSCPAWGGVVDCMGSSPTFTCMGAQWVPVGCENEFHCVSQCFK